MSLLVRDEAAIIRSNIEFHHRIGVDCFVITDNGSIDGTREILADLAAHYPIHLIDQPAHTMQQDRWVNHMAMLARERFGAAWIINSDADEFWLPRGPSLKSEIPQGAGALLCRRWNMLPDRDALASSDYAFFRHTWRVVRPLLMNSESKMPPWNLSGPPMIMTPIGRKVMCRIDGLRHIGYGNHDVSHDLPVLHTDGIRIYHYPVRTFAEFESKVLNHGTSLENNPALPDSIGWHVRRWYALHRRGLLHEEYSRLVLDDARAQCYLDQGILTRDYSIWKQFAPVPIPNAG